jgi:pyruvate kinase
LLNAGQAKPRQTTSDTIMESANQAAETLPAAAIVTFTTSGATALRAARKRPPVPIVALTPCVGVARSLAGVWGVHAVVVEQMDDYEKMEAAAIRCATEADYARSGDTIVITAGLPLKTSGVTNVMRLVRVEQQDLGQTAT